MRFRRLDEGPLRTFALVFDPGDEVMALLRAFGSEHLRGGASCTAIGAFERATLAFFDRATLRYREIPVAAQAEVLAFTGNFASRAPTPDTPPPDADPPDPGLHAHAVLGVPDGATRGGHVLAAWVRSTLELMLPSRPGPSTAASTPRPGCR